MEYVDILRHLSMTEGYNVHFMHWEEFRDAVCGREYNMFAAADIVLAPPMDCDFWYVSVLSVPSSHCLTFIRDDSFGFIDFRHTTCYLDGLRGLDAHIICVPSFAKAEFRVSKSLQVASFDHIATTITHTHHPATLPITTYDQLALFPGWMLKRSYSNEGDYVRRIQDRAELNWDVTPEASFIVQEYVPFMAKVGEARVVITGGGMVDNITFTEPNWRCRRIFQWGYYKWMHPVSLNDLMYIFFSLLSCHVLISLYRGLTIVTRNNLENISLGRVIPINFVTGSAVVTKNVSPVTNLVTNNVSKISVLFRPPAQCG